MKPLVLLAGFPPYETAHIVRTLLESGSTVLAVPDTQTAVAHAGRDWVDLVLVRTGEAAQALRQAAPGTRLIALDSAHSFDPATLAKLVDASKRKR